MTEDAELLRRYAEERSEAAFAELVQRHLPLVYSVALRQVGGDVHLAEDVAQTVFAGLARKAGALTRHPVLSGWLYRSTQFAAIDAMRTERRRRAREQEAQAMHETSNSPDANIDAEKLRPVLDQVMGELNDGDRDAVMLRYFEGRPFAEVGRRLRLTEDAARMRVDRALEKLRERLARRGVTSTTGALTIALASQAGVAAPAGLVAAVTGGALTGVGATTAIVTFMSMAKFQVAVVGTLLVAGGSGLIIQQRANDGMRREIVGHGSQPQEIAKLREENQRLAGIAAEVKNYQNDSADMARLHDKAGALAQRLQVAAAAKARGGGGTVDKKTGMTVYPVSQLDQTPAPIVTSAPVYPFAMRRAGLGGTVVVSMVIDENGSVRDAYASKSTRSEFEDSAVDAVKKWKFQPSQKDGLPVGVKIDVPIVFSLDKATGEPWF